MAALGDITLIYFDTETTGMDPFFNGARVVQAAAIKVRGGEIVETFDSLINPQCHIPAEVVRVHGIDDTKVVDAPVFGEVLPDLLKVLSGGWVVIHNAPFDLAFLDWGIQEYSLPPVRLKVIDTLIVARRHCNYPGNALRRIAEWYGIRTPEPHQALTDVTILRHVTERMFADLGRSSIEQLKRLRGVGEVVLGGAEMIPEFWQTVIEQGRKVVFIYQNHRGEREQEIYPIRYFTRSRKDFILGTCARTGMELTFRIDRILEVRNPEE